MAARMSTTGDDTPQAEDVHEWVSLDVGDETFLFDLTYLTSNWTCIFGGGCQGVLTEPAPEMEQGCCSYGAHFTDKDDRRHIRELSEELTADEWQYKKTAKKLGGPLHKT